MGSTERGASANDGRDLLIASARAIAARLGATVHAATWVSDRIGNVLVLQLDPSGRHVARVLFSDREQEDYAGEDADALGIRAALNTRLETVIRAKLPPRGD
jgi:hypothetical protein